MKAEDLKKRTKLFALRILKLAAALPNTLKAEQLEGNWYALVRQWAQTIARLVEDVRGRIHSKDRNVVEESDESAFWLEIIIEGAFLSEVRVKPLLDEANELTKIMVKSRISASRRVRANRQSAIGNRQSE